MGRTRTVFALRLDLDQDLALAHDLYDLAHIAARFVQELEFLA
jgi:hypothetical protein